uniref:Uncharacterized protein n=1 Tax=Ditylenchus dipsaci TaxID=166011 RepID=A0A915ESM6_9BILA
MMPKPKKSSDADDCHENLGQLRDELFGQLQFRSVQVGDLQKEVFWFATGDLKLLSALYGHMGSASSHPCLLPVSTLYPTRSASLLQVSQAWNECNAKAQAQINEFGKLVDDYVTFLKEKLPSMTITPKCHLLYSHVQSFMDQHLFWGLISEQSIEALHAVVNRDERRLASQRNRSEIVVKIIQYSFLRNVLFDMEIVCEDDDELFK